MIRYSPPWADTAIEAAYVRHEEQRHEDALEDALEDARNDAQDDVRMAGEDTGPLVDALAESRRVVAGLRRA